MSTCEQCPQGCLQANIIKNCQATPCDECPSSYFGNFLVNHENREGETNEATTTSSRETNYESG